MSTATGTVSAGTGLVSGIDYSSLISKMIAADSAPVTALQTKEATLQTQQTALSTIQSSLNSLDSAVQSLVSTGSFYSMTASSSDSSVVSATADETASAGTHTVVVKQLAQSSSIASQGFKDKDGTAIADSSGTFSFKLGQTGSTVSINVSASTTLQNLADAINNKDAGVTASVIDDGSDSNPYRLVLTSNATGTDNQIDIVHNDTSVNLATNSIGNAVADSSNAFDGTIATSGTYTGATDANVVIQMTSSGAVGAATYRVSTDGGSTWLDQTFTTSTDPTDVYDGMQVSFAPGTTHFAVGDSFSLNAFNPDLQDAKDAIVKVDGIQVTRSSNAIDDVLKGVTLNLNSVSSDTQTLAVNANTSDVESTIASFVSAYNSAISEINTQTSYNADSKTAAALFSDSGVQNIKDNLQSAIKLILGGNGDYTSLSSIGITFNSSYELEVDNSTLEAALQADPEAVANLFTASGTSTSSNVSYVGSSSSTQPGTYAVKVLTAAEQASVSGSTAWTSNQALSSNETLTIADGSEEPVNVTLTAGMTKSAIVSAINGALGDKNVSATASFDDGGHLTIKTNDYGSEEKISVTSNKANAGSELGFDTTAATDAGVDVAATINGTHVAGIGQTVLGPTGSNIDGLNLTLSGLAGTSATVTLNKGVATQLSQLIDSYNDSTSGFFATRTASIDTQTSTMQNNISTLQSRLDDEQARLEKEFTNLETQLSSLSEMSDTVTNTLAAAVTSLSNSSIANKSSSG